MQPIATLKNLSLSVPHKKLFEQVNFTLNKGDKIGVLGLNGHGKSSLFKVLAQKVTPDTTVPPFEYDKSQELSIFYVPQELEGPKDLSLQNYFYEFYPQMKELKLQVDQISAQLETGEGDVEALIEKQTQLFERLDELNEHKIYKQYLSYLTSYGVFDDQRIVSDLSGGEQRKIGLALGLSCPHEVILWDEPTNHLDLDTIKEFEEELKNSKKTFLLISHDRTLLDHVCTRILHIQQGKLNTFSGGYQKYLEYLQEKALSDQKQMDKLSNKHRRELAWMRQGVKARRTRSKKRVEDFQSLQSELEKFKALKRRSVELDLQHSGRKTKQLVKALDLSIKLGNLQVFTDVSLTLQKGDKVALLGKNGSGKSTLLKIITGELSPDQGHVERGHELKIGYFSQKREEIDESMTPWDWIGEGQDFIYPQEGVKKHVASYLESFLFSREEIRRPISTFSGGEKNRLQLARFMKSPCDVWIFDEPTNDLDLETIGVLEEELKNYPGALIIVSHDRSFLDNTTEKCWLLHNGELNSFEAGFAQAEDYLETLKLLEKQEQQQQKAKLKEAEKIDRGNTFNDQKDEAKKQKEIDLLEAKILQIETDIEQTQKELGEIDYQNMSKTDKERLTQLQKVLSEQEQDLSKSWELLNKII